MWKSAIRLCPEYDSLRLFPQFLQRVHRRKHNAGGGHRAAFEMQYTLRSRNRLYSEGTSEDHSQLRSRCTDMVLKSTVHSMRKEEQCRHTGWPPRSQDSETDPHSKAAHHSRLPFVQGGEFLTPAFVYIQMFELKFYLVKIQNSVSYYASSVSITPSPPGMATEAMGSQIEGIFIKQHVLLDLWSTQHCGPDELGGHDFFFYFVKTTCIAEEK